MYRLDTDSISNKGKSTHRKTQSPKEIRTRNTQAKSREELTSPNNPHVLSAWKPSKGWVKGFRERQLQIALELT